MASALRSVAGWLSREASADSDEGLVDGDSGEFNRLTSEEPVRIPADRKILARMLVEVAKADGEMLDAEREFLGQFLDPSLGSVEELARLPNLTPDELGTTAPETRSTMLLLAWTLAFADRDLSIKELGRLRVFARGLHLEPDTSEELRRAAVAHILMGAMDHTYRSGSRDPAGYEEVQAFAANAGLTPANLEKYEVRAKARRGLA